MPSLETLLLTHIIVSSVATCTIRCEKLQLMQHFKKIYHFFDVVSTIVGSLSNDDGAAAEDDA